MELRHLGGEPLEHGRLAPPVLVDTDHEQPQVAPRVEARDDEHRPRAADQSEVSILPWCPVSTNHSSPGDVGEHDAGHHVHHLQREHLVQAAVKTRLTSAMRRGINHAQSLEFLNFDTKSFH